VTTIKARVALVTGANRGLGLETSRQLLAQGVNVVMAGRDDAALAGALQSLGHDETRAMAVRLDVTDAASIRSAQREIA